MEELITAIDEAGFKKAMSNFASGVTIVTTEHGGQWFGMTVAAFSSLSLRPPLVLICIDKSVKTHDAIRDGERFVVNVLREGQDDLSNRFASRSDDKFSGVPTRLGKLKAPMLEHVLANIECRLHESLPGGDHTVFVGEVVSAELHDGAPLLYYKGAYRKLAD